MPNGGIDGIYTFDLEKKRQIDIDDLSFAVPHNIAVSDDGRKIYATHSGASSNKVSVLVTRPDHSGLTLETEIEVENNPFGLAFVPH